MKSSPENKLTNQQHDVNDKRYAKTWKELIATDLEMDPALAGEEAPPPTMPKTRGECKGRKWRCGFLGCRHHCASEIRASRREGNAPFLAVRPLDLSRNECSLDIADAVEAGLMELSAPQIMEALGYRGLRTSYAANHGDSVVNFMDRLRTAMEAHGITAEDAREALRDNADNIKVHGLPPLHYESIGNRYGDPVSDLEITTGSGGDGCDLPGGVNWFGE